MIVYKATNIFNNKVYIGITTKDLETRKKIHKRDSKSKNTYFYRAIQKYGFESFVWEVIDSASTKKELEEKERHYIKLYDSFDNKEKGYNSTSGGGNLYEMTDEERKRRSERAKGENNPMYGTVSPMAGKKFTDEHKDKISKALKGMKRPKQTGSNNPSARAVVNLDTGEVFETIRKATQKYPNTNRHQIGSVCRGKGKTSGGYRWAYKEDVEAS